MEEEKSKVEIKKWIDSIELRFNSPSKESTKTTQLQAKTNDEMIMEKHLSELSLFRWMTYGYVELVKKLCKSKKPKSE